MTKEEIETRKKGLEATKEQAIANVHLIIGAIQDCDYWLAELAKRKDTSDG